MHQSAATQDVVCTAGAAVKLACGRVIRQGKALGKWRQSNEALQPPSMHSYNLLLVTIYYGCL